MPAILLKTGGARSLFDMKGKKQGKLSMPMAFKFYISEKFISRKSAIVPERMYIYCLSVTSFDVGSNLSTFLSNNDL